VVVASLLLALLAGCGGDDDEEPAPAPDPPREEPRTEPEPEEADEPQIGDGRGGIRLEQVTELDSPLHLVQPPGGGRDLFVVEQGGRIVRLAPDRSTETFVDLSGEVSAGGEQGLLSVAFAPDYDRGGDLYVNYTDTGGTTRVVELHSPDGERVETDRREVLSIEQPFANHNGGLLLFGPDEMLYVGTGDGGGAGDPERTALDRSSLLGKILRIDPRPGPDRGYRIPSDNPFRGEDGARSEIWSYGLRNPWRFSFDRGGDALAVADVGEREREEVNLVEADEAAGASFGWSAFEGELPFNPDQESPDAIDPVLTYPLEGGNCAITGGYVVRDERLTSLYGRYLYGDFCGGELRSFTAEPGQEADDDRPLGPEIEQLSSFGEDSAGRLYATSLAGPVYRLEPRNGGGR
jgi:glucose/arabinose dehydrogenase